MQSPVPTNFATNLQDRKRASRRRSIIHEFCQNTSTHALPGIARGASIYNKLFWSISFLVFMSIMIYFIVTTIIAYFHYPTNIDVDVVSEWPQYFPAVSVCNMSPIRRDKFEEPFYEFLRRSALIKENSSVFDAYDNLNIAKFAMEIFDRNETLDPYFFTLQSILHSCTFNNQPCSADDFITFVSSYYGYCYTFNARLKNKSQESVRYANDYGGDGVLELSFYTYTHQYILLFPTGKFIFERNRYTRRPIFVNWCFWERVRYCSPCPW